MSKNWFSLNFLISKFRRTYFKRMSETTYPKTLTDFGYGFNEDGLLKQLDPETGKLTDKGFQFIDQEHYEALGNVITEHVYKILEEKGMKKIYVCSNVPEKQSAFIFMNKEKLDHPKKLMVLIHGSGVVRAGQWARSLIINNSLSHGTQLPYIKKAIELGYDVLLTNTNDNYRSINGEMRDIPGHSTPEEHGRTIWEKYVMACNPEAVAIVAHSYGGVVTINLAKKYQQFFKDKVFAIGFTDSVHGMLGLDKKLSTHLKNIGRNWVTSHKSLNNLVSESGNDIPRYSAGHIRHEWTSYSCMSALFDFFEEKYEAFNKS